MVVTYQSTGTMTTTNNKRLTNKKGKSVESIKLDLEVIATLVECDEPLNDDVKQWIITALARAREKVTSFEKEARTGPQ